MAQGAAAPIRLRLIWFVAAIALSPMGLKALEPPRPGEVKKYAADGSFTKRLANSAQFGNHRTHPRLIWNLQRKLLKAQGQTDAQITSAMGNAPPPAWRGGLPASGTPRVAVLLVDFAEYPHAPNQLQPEVSDKFFGGGNASDAPYESLRNYYQRSSYSKLTIQGTVFDWYRATQPRSYYEGLGFGPGEEALMMEVLNHWAAQGSDFSQFDNDGDGRIDALFIKWTGPDNGWSNFWWAYQWEWHSNPSYRVSGKSLGNYVWSWIANVNYDGRSDYYPRTDIHETGHLLGLPDLYDYDSTQGPDGGVGGLDIMHSNWGDHNCFSKYMLDWLAPTEVLSGSITKTLNPSGTSQDCVLIMPGIPTGTLFGEFFMAQYRKRSVGNDPSSYPTDGLLIWHVDSTLNTAGTDFKYDNSYTAHKYLRLMEADGLEEIERNYSTDAGDYYVPGRILSNTTTPNSRAYSGSATGVTVDQLTSPSATMSGRFGTVTAPDISGATSLAWEGCYPPNGVIDPDEQIQMNVDLRNVGAGGTTNLVATLQATGGVVAPSSPQTYGALAPNSSAVTRVFTFRAAGDCGATLTLSLQLQDGATSLNTLTFINPLGVRVQSYSCCHVAPGDLDGDGDVDQTDFGYLQVCLTDVGIPQFDPVCGAARLDMDTDVDSDDVGVLRGCMSGPQAPARFDCRP